MVVVDLLSRSSLSQQTEESLLYLGRLSLSCALLVELLTKPNEGFRVNFSIDFLPCPVGFLLAFGFRVGCLISYWLLLFYNPFH